MKAGRKVIGTIGLGKEKTAADCSGRSVHARIGFSFADLVPVVGRVKLLDDFLAVQQDDFSCFDAPVIQHPQDSAVKGEVLRIGKMVSVVPHLAVG